MKVLLSWLNDYLDFEGYSLEELAIIIEDLGHEVEAIQPIDFRGVVVGEVIALQAHPNADRLRVAQVNLGDQVETIVCGAPNLAIGQKVPVARVGTQLPNGVMIEERAIRGITSRGMICAEDELGLGSDHEGILVLDAQRTSGEPFSSNRGVDAVLAIAITPNRGDVLSLVGLSRDVAARLGQKPSPLDNQLTITLDQIPSIQLDAPEDCPLYAGRYIDKVESLKLPNIFSQRLRAVDHSIIHPIVDVTNYVMEELGVPLHAFDAKKIVEPITIRKAKPGETIKLLDGKTYTLDSDMLVIADAERAIAVAGIMGGFDSAVDVTTSRILLEAAYFNPASIRRTRQKLRIESDASYRFERNVDSNAVQQASDRAAQLYAEHGHALIGATRLVGQPIVPRRVTFDADQINDRLGTAIDTKQMLIILNRLGFQQEQQRLLIPSWRHDINLWEDLSEEIARVVGFGQIPRSPIQVERPQSQSYDKLFHKREWLKDQFIRLGWTEHIGSTFLSPAEVVVLGEPRGVIQLANPITEEASFLRSTLKISMLKALARNPIYADLAFLEIGTVFSESGEHKNIALGWTTRQQSFPTSFALDGEVQKIEQSLLDRYKIRRPVWYWEGPVDDFIKQAPSGAKEAIRPTFVHPVRMPSRYQPVMRDLAMLLAKNIAVDEIADLLKGTNYVVDIELFDEFSSEKLGNQKSLAFHILLEHPDRTLTSQEIQETMDSLSELLIKEFKATIR